MTNIKTQKLLLLKGLMASCIALFMLWTTGAQAQIASYGFTQTSGTYTPVSGGTQLIAAAADDVSSSATNIGFTFNLAGTNYTQFIANSNGHIRLGATAPTSTYTPISATSNTGAISGFGRDGRSGGAVVYQLTGTAPNRILTIDYPDFNPTYSNATYKQSFQIQLFETSNLIKIVYGPNASPTTYTCQVGIRASTTDFANRTTTTNWAASTAGVAASTMTWSATVYPASGLTYTWTPPSCAAPTALLGSPTPTTTANISWTAPLTPPSNGYEYAVTTSATPPVSGTAFAGTSTSVTGLTANTTYYLHVRSYCGGSDYSAWVTSSFYTGYCAVSVTTTGDNISTFTTSGGITNISNTSTGTGAYEGFTSQSVSQTAGSPINFSGTYVGGSAGFSIWVDWNNNLQFEVGERVYTATITAASWSGSFTVPSGQALGNYRMRIRAQWNTLDPPACGNITYGQAEDYTFSVVTPPSCIAPTSPTGSPTTATTANISWTAPLTPPSNGYEYAVTTSATPPGSGTAFAGTSTSVSGLTAQTTYYLHVRSYCGGSSYSSWATSAAFTTPCTAISSLPWTEGFESATLPNLPSACWLEDPSSGDWITTNNSSSTYDADARTGAQFLRDAFSATNEFVWTPGFALTSGQSYDFSFWWAGDTYSGWTGDIFYNTVQSSTGATQMGSSFVTSGTTTTKTYAQAKRTFVAPTTGAYYFAVRVNAGGGPWYLSFDDFRFEQTPSCAAPSALLGTPTTTTTANISWTAPLTPPSNGYEYAVTTSATPPGSGTTFAGTSTSVSGLTAQTTYYLHVRSYCGGSSYSSWATSATFTTPCAAIGSLPWTEGFESATLPNLPSACWLEDPSSGDWVTTNNSNSTYDADARTGAQFLRDAYSATNEFVWTPGFALTSGQSYDFSFWWAGDTYSNWTGDIFYNTVQSGTGATQMGSSFVISGTTTTKTYAQAKRTFIAPTTGTYYFAVRVNATSTPWYLSFDDFRFEQTPSCAAPSALLGTPTTTTTANISWTAPLTPPSNGYEYAVTTSATPPGSGTAFAGTSTSVSGLTASTTYYLHVRSYCGGSDYSSWATSASFTTFMDCSAATVITCGTNFSFSVASGSGTWNTTATGTCSATPGKEKLYSFTPAITGIYYLDNTVSGSGEFADAYIKPATGGCSDALSWTCVGWYLSSLQHYSLGTLTAGTEYYIMVDAEDVTDGATQTLKIACIVPPPANDNCAGAVSFASIPTDGSCANLTLNTAGATQSLAGCAGTADDDVWFKFVQPTGFTTINFANTTVSGNTDRVTQFFDACGGASLICSDPETGTVTGLTPGNTYYGRIYTYGSGTSTNVTVCLSVPPPAPANDDCAGAKLLANCAKPDTTKNLSGATQSLAAITCGSYTGTADDDIWYKFVASASTMYVTCFSSYDAVMDLRSGACNGINIECADDGIGANTFEDIVATGLTVGNTYYVRIYSYASTKPNATDYVWVTVGEGGCWQGASSTDWADVNNWSNLAVPNACATNVTIPAGTQFSPTISAASYAVGSVNISSGVTLTITGSNNLNVCGNWNAGSGSLVTVSGTGKVVLNGTVAQTVNGKTKFSTLQVDKSSSSTTLASGSTVDINTALELKAGNINVSTGSLTLKSADADNAAMLDNFSTGFSGTITGSIKAERGYNFASDPGLHKQHYFSSPIDNVAITQFAPASGVDGGWVTPKSNCDEMAMALGTNYGNVFEYDESHVSTCHLEAWKVRSAGNADNGRGYSVVKPSAGTLTLTGVPNLGNYTIGGLTNSNWISMLTPQGNSYESGWSLLGNPYSASLDLDYTVNADFDNAIQVLHTSGMYAGTYQPITMSGSGVIAPFQGFMAHKTLTGGTSTFSINAANRSRTTATFQKNGEHQMNLTVLGNGFADVTYFNFDANSTTGFDADKDGGKLASYDGQPTLYSIIGAVWTSINTNPDVASTPSIPVGFNPGSNGAYQITGGGFEDLQNTTVYLEDKQTNTMHNLTALPEYTFTANKSDATERFVLHFNYEMPSSIQTIVSNSLNIFSYENNVVVDFNNAKISGEHTIVIYDIMGREISNEKFVGKVYTKALDVQEPMYVVVKTNDGNNVTSKKLFVTK